MPQSTIKPVINSALPATNQSRCVKHTSFSCQPVTQTSFLKLELQAARYSLGGDSAGERESLRPTCNPIFVALRAELPPEAELMLNSPSTRRQRTSGQKRGLRNKEATALVEEK